MKYKVISSNRLDAVVHEVNIALAQDWKLQGGISACETRSGGFGSAIFAQAMIKEEIKNDKT